MSRHRPEVLAPVVLVAAALVAGVATMTPWLVGGFYDDGIYVVLAKALATGQGYRYLNIPGLPRATHYPPGYPALLALLWKAWPAFPANTALFKFANAACVAASAFGAYLLARRRLALSPWIAAGVAAFFTISIPVLLLSAVVMSEVFFLALLFPALLLAERAVEKGGWQLAVAAGAMAGALFLVRTIGVVLIPAAVLVFALRRRWPELGAFLAAALVCVLPWQWWVSRYDPMIPAAIHSGYGAYSGWIGEALHGRGPGFFADVFVRNAGGLSRIVRAIFSPIPTGVPALAFVACFAALFLAGLWHLRRRAPVVALFVPGYIAIVTLWAFGPDRFLFGIWPLLGIVLAAGVLEAVQSRAPSRRRWIAPAAIGVALLGIAGHLRYDVRGVQGHYWEGAQRSRHERALPLVAWARDRAPAGAVLSVESDPLVYLYSGRMAVPQVGWRVSAYLAPRGPVAEADDMSEMIGTFRPSLVMIRDGDSDAALAAQEFLRRHPGVLRQVDSLPDGGAVFEVVTSTAGLR